jgi:hypothetical protein
MTVSDWPGRRRQRADPGALALAFFVPPSQASSAAGSAASSPARNERLECFLITSGLLLDGERAWLAAAPFAPV